MAPPFPISLPCLPFTPRRWGSLLGPLPSFTAGGGGIPSCLQEGKTGFRFSYWTSAWSCSICPLAGWSREEGCRGVAGCWRGPRWWGCPSLSWSGAHSAEGCSVWLSCWFSYLWGCPLGEEAFWRVMLPASACPAGEGGDEIPTESVWHIKLNRLGLSDRDAEVMGLAWDPLLRLRREIWQQWLEDRKQSKP